MARLVLWLAVGFSCVLGACVAAGLLCGTGERLRALWHRLWGCGWACVLLAVVATIHGGTKNVTNRFTADAGLTVVNAEITIPTNDVEDAGMAVSWTGPDESQAVNFRDLASEAWRALGVDGWLFDDRFYEGGTNTAYFSANAPASNMVMRAHYHLGSDLPPVEVEGDGITILDFRDSSTNVVITYAVESAVLGDNAGTVRVEMQEDRGSVWVGVRWDAVSGGVTNTVTIPGFWIGRDTRWRVRLEVGE